MRLKEQDITNDNARFKIPFDAKPSSLGDCPLGVRFKSSVLMPPSRMTGDCSALCCCAGDGDLNRAVESEATGVPNRG